MDGLEATRRIKMTPRGRETAVVALTASALAEDQQQVAASGADDFLPKPCHEHELLEKIRVHVNVAYNYEEAAETTGESSPGATPWNAERLGELPLDLVEDLRNATVTGNKRLLDKLIVKVRQTNDGASADALQQLANGYEYDALTGLLEEACRR
jgi:DNA-binding response OmpR family regulator